MIFPGDVINNRYRADEIYARGGMGEVWRCQDISLGRQVILKTVSPQFIASNTTGSKIFIDEAKIGASLIGHPNVVAVFDIIDQPAAKPPILAISMEFVEGMSCSDWITKSPTMVNDTTRHYMSLMVAMEVCKALSYAHRNSILHRDIKPLNIFISKYGITKLGDFGIARYMDAVTRTHTVWHFRSPAYSAPEQWEDKKPTMRTDVYQLGCTLYHLFTGRPPFEASSPAALMSKHLKEIPVDPKTLNPLISDDLSKLIVRCLAKKDTERPGIWNLVDSIAHSLQQKYTINIKYDSADSSLVNSIAAITDFSMEDLADSKEFVWDYADYNEAISEAFELLMLSKVEVDLTVTSTTPPAAKT